MSEGPGLYLPERFREDRPGTVRELLRAHPFATLITVRDGAPVVSHLPLALDEETDPREPVLLGHLSKLNPQWRDLREGLPVTAVFHGPHAYITPVWYEENDVPTWNYATVHVRGVARPVEGYRELLGLLRRQAARFDAGPPAGWRFALPDDLRTEEQVCGAIAGFELRLSELVVSAKYKLGQNRSERDRRSVIDGLEARGDAGSLGVARLMRDGLTPR